MKKIAVTMGDPSGTGPEIAEKYFSDSSVDSDRFCLIGPRSLKSRFLSLVDYIGVGAIGLEAQSGLPSVEGSKTAIDALNLSTEGCLNGSFSSVVTLPISKAWMTQAGFQHPGHTEYFADRWGGQPTMAFVGTQMKVILCSWHIPLKEVPESLTPESVNRSVAVAYDLVNALGGVNTPKIAVCGLNPHAGEGGLLGQEEVDFLTPHLEDLKNQYPGLSGPYPADTVFWRHLRGDFDVVVALYHDQGLIPLKTVEFETAVNVTMGLPFIRTSPDHGTGFDIAGKGIASIDSFSHAVEVCMQLERAKNGG